MQERQFVSFNPDGTIRVDVSDDAEIEQWLTIGRAKIKHVRKYGEMLEDADEAMRAVDETFRSESGFTPEVKELMQRVMSGEALENLVGIEMLEAADANQMQGKYVALLQRYLYTDANPYPHIWIELLNDADLMAPVIDTRETGDLPMFCFGQETIQEVLNHWTAVPLTRGAVPPQQAASAPANRAGRRQAARKTTQSPSNRPVSVVSTAK